MSKMLNEETIRSTTPRGNLLRTIAVLKSARARISDPEHWTRGALSRNICGDEVSADSPNACQWCMVGVLDISGFSPEVWRAESYLKLTTGGYIDQFNDHPDTTHADVLAAYDRAIEMAEADLVK